jgi:hypothetical protein
MSCRLNQPKKSLSAEESDSIDISSSLSKNKLWRTLQYGVRTVFDPVAATFGWLHIFASLKRVLFQEARDHYADLLVKHGSPCSLVRHNGHEAYCQMCGYCMIELDLPGQWCIQTCSRHFYASFGGLEQYVKLMNNWDRVAPGDLSSAHAGSEPSAAAPLSSGHPGSEPSAAAPLSSETLSSAPFSSRKCLPVGCKGNVTAPVAVVLD